MMSQLDSFDGYQFLEHLYTGKNSLVYRVRESQSQATAILKILNSDYRRVKTTRSSFWEPLTFPTTGHRNGVHCGISYPLPVQWDLITSLTFYNDYSIIVKSENEFSNSQQNITGIFITSGSFLIFVEMSFGRNHPYFSPDFVDDLAGSGPDNDWHKRLNVNIGYYL